MFVLLLLLGISDVANESETQLVIEQN